MARSYPVARASSPAAADFSAELNPEQLAAVETQARHALVIAGAGSGKTRTLTYRVARLLSLGVPPWRILLLTFTNKAAKEMLDRVRDLCPDGDTGALWGGTFHSVANRLLRRHADLLGYTPSFTILDSDDRRSMLKRLVKELGDDRASARFPKADVLGSIFSLACNCGEVWHDVLRAEYGHLQRHEEAIGAIYEAYEKAKKANNAMDFDDLLLQAVALLRGNDEVRDRYRNQFLHVLVDEYQDTNALQDELIDLLAGGPETSLMAVGDDAQSIYSWRGADVRHILDFQARYPGAEVFKIETNYRSVPSILELSNAAIAANKRRFEKNLRPARAEGEMIPALVPAPDSRVEGMFVAQRIGELIDAGTPPQDIAVLYRAHYNSLDVQMELARAGIPFRLTSGIRFFEQAHVKDAMALIRLAQNPLDEVSFRRLVLTIPKVGGVMAGKLWQLWTAAYRETPDAAPAPEGEAEEVHDFSARFGACRVSPGVRPYWEALLHALDGLSEDGAWAPPAAMVESAVSYLDAYMQQAYDDYEERLADLEQLADAAATFADVQEFLAQTALLTNADGGETADAGRVTLSTIHQAKGLEWKVVFVIALCDGVFPHRRVIDAGDRDALEEELRLFYVAVTRAEDQLYLSYPRVNLRSYDGSLHQYPSRFLSFCPSELMELWEV